MTTAERLLMKRALSLLTRMPELHEVSYRMGQAGEKATPETMQREFHVGQVLLSEASQVANALYARIAEKP